jgi:HlyD family secretion protein
MTTQKKIAVTGIVIILAIVGIYRFSIIRSQKLGNIIRIERGNITQEVRVTGKAKAATTVDLAFESTGRIIGAYTSVGSSVKAGQTLAELDHSELEAQMKQAEASVAAETARLGELKRGTRPEEIAIQKVKVENAEALVEDAIRNLGDKIGDAYTKSDDAIYNVSDQLFDNPKTTPSFKVSVTDSTLRTNLANKRQELEAMFAVWKNNVSGPRNASTIMFLTDESTEKLGLVSAFLDVLSQAINAAQPNAQFSQTNLDTFRANVSTARTAVNTGITNLSAAKEKYRSARATLMLETNELTLKNAGSTKESIAAAEAAVQSAEAKVQSIQVGIGKMILRAPISGIVTVQDFNVGETAQIGAVGLSLMSESKLQVEAQVPEIDIGNIVRGNSVSLTFDAFPGEVFAGVVTYVDPASTLIDGVVNFKVTVALEKNDKRLKSGLTANLVIEVSHKDGVVRVPLYALTERDGKMFASKQDGSNVSEVEVVVGVRGQDGFVEVVSGLSEGDQILSSQTKK